MNSFDTATKLDIAHSFSQAATSYDAVAGLQRRIGHRLLGLVPERSRRTVLDLGCGTGYFAPHLQDMFQAEQILGLDMAQGMIDYAKRQSDLPNMGWCCADAESLPLHDGSLSMIFSNLALQWCSDLSKIMAEAMRVLQPGGCLAFSTLGPQTLCELKTAWQQVDDYVHVNHFLDLQEIQSAINAVGFIGTAQEEQIIAQYQQLRGLTGELKSLGAHNLNRGRPVGLTGRNSIQKLLQAYEGYRDDQGMLPATYQIYYFVLNKNAK